MSDPKERLTLGVSELELERRWGLAREVMRVEGVDHLLARDDEQFLGGNLRWFTDLIARHSYPSSVVFPLDDQMSLITCGAARPGPPSPPEWAVRGVKTRLSGPYFPTAAHTHPIEASLVAEALSDGGAKRVGLVGKKSISLSLYEELVKQMPSLEFVDLTDQIDRLKMIKSPEEFELIKGTIALQDQVCQHLRETIRPGMRDFEVLAETEYKSTLLGSERCLVQVNSGPQGTVVPFNIRRFQNRLIREGDQVSVLIEVNGPGGYYAELGRIFTIGPAQDELQKAMEVAVAAQLNSLAMVKPGADPAAILESNNEFLTSRGYAPELRLYAHGQGYDLIERPFFMASETAKLAPNMNLTVHPGAVNDKAWAVVVDNYFLLEDGLTQCLHKTPKEIIEL